MCYIEQDNYKSIYNINIKNLNLALSLGLLK